MKNNQVMEVILQRRSIRKFDAEAGGRTVGTIGARQSTLEVYHCQSLRI